MRILDSLINKFESSSFKRSFQASLIKLLPTKSVYAHCDIPCGIYDPYPAQIAAHTIIRMTKLLQEAGSDAHKIARITHVKEEHGGKVEEELETLWADYFKEEHLKEYRTF